ncbi:MAG: Ig-like domain-containing protein [Planctomycetes bacterium]|nr:Ig-like domain-containing protein [Planctomycetota bacterium]
MGWRQDELHGKGTAESAPQRRANCRKRSVGSPVRNLFQACPHPVRHRLAQGSRDPLLCPRVPPMGEIQPTFLSPSPRNGLLLGTLLLFLTSACHERRQAPPEVGVGDAVLLEVSPSAGEGGVAISREAILRFSAPIDPSSVRPEAISVEHAGTPIATRLHLAPTRDTVTLFPVQPWPSAAELEVVLVDGGLRADNGRAVDADQDGRIGGSRRVAFQVANLARVADTEICGRVFASEPGSKGADVPLAGVTVTVDGLDTQCFAVTDPLGNFCLEDVPAGDVFVHVRGSTAHGAPAGFFYPDVGKTWHAPAGQRATVGTVYLPTVSHMALQAASATQDTPVQIVEEQLQRVADPDLRELLRATRIVVPADSLFADDGRRGGRVGIGPVNRDRLPGQLPPGLALPIVITIQTDGPTNFDRPVPVCFPNVPDPATGLPLPPGSKSALWSFNHDTGRFEVVGPMTVSADGTTICTDPGVGVRAPGWHGSAPGSPGSGPPPGGPCEGPDCCTNCCKKTVWDVTADVARIAADLAYCASELTGIAAIVRCLIDLVNSGFATYDFAVALGATVHEGMTPAELIVLKNRLRDRIAEFTALIESCNTEVVVRRVTAIKNCLARLVGRANELCEAYRQCVDIWGRDAACALIAAIDEALALATHYEEIIESYVNHGIRRAAMTALLAVLERVCEHLEPESGSGLTAAEAAELQALFTAAAGAFPPPEQGVGIRDYLAGGYLGAAVVAEVAHGVAQSIHARIGRAEARQVAYALDAPLGSGQVRRGQTTSIGTLDLLLPASAEYALHQYDPFHRRLGVAYGVTAATGQRTTLRSPLLVSVTGMADQDGDGLVDAAEFVFGTSAELADTDRDGLSDGDEVHGGTNPLDGIDAAVRLIAALPTVGPAVDLCADDGAVVVACGDDGIEIFNAWQNMTPTPVARLDTPGSAVRAACARLRVAVADGPAGLAIVDLNEPATPVLRHQVALGDVQAVAVAGGVVVAGTTGGRIAVVDVERGILLMERTIGDAIVDLQVLGDFVYALTSSRLHVSRIDGGVLNAVTELAIGRSRQVRLVLAQEHLLAVDWTGFTAIDVRVPGSPTILAETATQQRGWRHLALDGSGNAVCVVGLNANPDQSDDLQLYRLADFRVPAEFVRDFTGPEFPDFEPGVLSAVVVYNGLAWLADRRGRLFCARYRMRDVASELPSVSLTTSATQGTIEEGKVLVVRAETADDVQVSHVDFELDGRRLVSDGTYPFELRLTAPAMQLANRLTFGAKCWDTGGNMAIATTVVVTVTPDTSPPTVVRSQPGSGGVVLAGAPAELVCSFSEPVDPATVHVGSLLLVGAGPDDQFGTGDDEPVVIDQAGWRASVQSAIWSSNAALTAQRYRAALGGVADVAGNAMAPRSWDFVAYEGLRATFFADAGSAGVERFFAGDQPLSVTEYRNGAAPRQVNTTVVPNIHFRDRNGNWATHAGANGIWETSSLTSPGGDDIVWSLPDRFGVLIEGSLVVPSAGDVTFGVTIDDSFQLELSGQVRGSYLGCTSPTLVTLPTVGLPAGASAMRMAAADVCGSQFALILQAVGGGFPGGVVPASAFRAPR